MEIKNQKQIKQNKMIRVWMLNHKIQNHAPQNISFSAYSDVCFRKGVHWHECVVLSYISDFFLLQDFSGCSYGISIWRLSWTLVMKNLEGTFLSMLCKVHTLGNGCGVSWTRQRHKGCVAAKAVARVGVSTGLRCQHWTFSWEIILCLKAQAVKWVVICYLFFQTLWSTVYIFLEIQ